MNSKNGIGGRRNTYKEGRQPKDRRTGDKLGNKQLDRITGGANSNPDSGRQSGPDATPYCIDYGHRKRTATINLVDGSNRYTATYNGFTREWHGDADQIPDGHKKTAEGYYT